MATQGSGSTSEKKKPVLYIKTFGCQMNDRDSELLAGMFLERGCSLTNGPEKADVVLYNTCSVRGHAEERVWGGMGLLKHLKKDRPGLVLGVIGCMARIHGKKIFDRLPHVDLVCGPAQIYEVPQFIEDILKRNEKKILATGEEARPSDGRRIPHVHSAITTYVSIMEGCNNFCSYCVVPYARGRECSRSLPEVIDEVTYLAREGFKEVTLLGQNVNSYAGGFVKLLEEVDKVDGIVRIRFTTSHPKDASEGVFKAMRDLSSVCEYLHLPVQSGSNKILQAMSRRYTRESYLGLIDKLRKYIPGCGVTTDIIVGFPGEREEDFDETRKLLEEVEFDSTYIFKYSPRPYTKAVELEDDVPKKVKEERNQILLKLQDEISLKKNKALIGEEVEVLVEGVNTKKSLLNAKRQPPTTVKGRTRTNKLVVFGGTKELIGKLVNVKINRVTPHTLLGEVNE